MQLCHLKGDTIPLSVVKSKVCSIDLSLDRRTWAQAKGQCRWYQRIHHLNPSANIAMSKLGFSVWRISSDQGERHRSWSTVLCPCADCSRFPSSSIVLLWISLILAVKSWICTATNHLSGVATNELVVFLLHLVGPTKAQFSVIMHCMKRAAPWARFRTASLQSYSLMLKFKPNACRSRYSNA